MLDNMKQCIELHKIANTKNIKFLCNYFQILFLSFGVLSNTVYVYYFKQIKQTIPVFIFLDVWFTNEEIPQLCK